MNKRLILLTIITACFSLSQVNATVALMIDGDINSELRYTPEKKLEGWDQFYLKATVEGGTKAKGCIIFGENDGYRGREVHFWDGTNRAFDFIVDKVYLSYSGIFNNNPASKLTVGNLSFQYHPYFFKMDYWDEGNYLERYYDQSKRGILIENAEVGGVNLGAFRLWDNPNVYTYGYQIGKPYKDGIANFYAINYYANDQAGDNYILSQHTYGFAINHKLGNNFSVEGVFGVLNESNTSAAQDKTASLYDLKLKYKINPQINADVQLLYIPESFDPIYRDRTPKFDLETGRLLKWNPIDKFFDQKGVNVSLSFEEGETRFKGTISNLNSLSSPDYPNNSKRLMVSASSLFGHNELSVWQKIEDLKIYRADNKLNTILYSLTRCQLKCPLSKGSHFIYAIGYRNSIENELEHKVSIEEQVNDGLLEGLKFEIGVKNVQRIINPFVRIDYETPLGITVLMNYHKLNRIEQKEFEYDEDDILIPIDNLISIGFTTSF